MKVKMVKNHHLPILPCNYQMTSKVGSWGQGSGSWTSYQEISSTRTLGSVVTNLFPCAPCFKAFSKRGCCLYFLFNAWGIFARILTKNTDISGCRSIYWNIMCFLPIGGSKGGARDAPPLGSKFFHFHAVFDKKLKNNSIFGSWRPPLGKILDPPLLPVTIWKKIFW